MTTLRHFKQTETLKDQLARSAKDARAKAWVLPAGAQRDEFLTRARGPIQRLRTMGQLSRDCSRWSSRL